jgi:hypothetical protein
LSKEHTLISELKPDAQIRIPLMAVVYIGLLPSGIGSPFIKQISRHFGDTILLKSFKTVYRSSFPLFSINNKIKSVAKLQYILNQIYIV